MTTLTSHLRWKRTISATAGSHPPPVPSIPNFHHPKQSHPPSRRQHLMVSQTAIQPALVVQEKQLGNVNYSNGPTDCLRSLKKLPEIKRLCGKRRPKHMQKSRKMLNRRFLTH
eukprot:6735435-Ditylum_brightwellii.AAC.1